MKFLAFGDSLTEGYYHFGTEFHPYTERLQALCLQENLHIEFVQEGISGEETESMIPRLEGLLQHSSSPFDYICILAGTNDLGDEEESAASIFQRLESMYSLALSHHPNTVLVVVTIPPTAFDRTYPDYLQRKTTINKQIWEFYEEKKGTGRLFYLDLFREVPYYVVPETHSENSVPEEVKSSYWDDNLHFNPSGYDYFGELLFRMLRSHFLRT